MTRAAAISCATAGRSRETTYSMMSSVRIADLTVVEEMSAMLSYSVGLNLTATALVRKAERANCGRRFAHCFLGGQYRTAILAARTWADHEDHHGEEYHDTRRI